VDVRDTRYQETGESYIKWSFMIFIAHQIMLVSKPKEQRSDLDSSVTLHSIK